MALIAFDSGEATRYPTYDTNTQNSWTKIANQPSNWEVKVGAGGGAGVSALVVYSGTNCYRILHKNGVTVGMRRTFNSVAYAESYISFMYRPTASASHTLEIFTLMDSTFATISVRLMQSPTGQLLVYAGSTPTLKATIEAGILSGTWTNIKIHQKTSDNTLEVIINDGSITDCSGTAMTDWQYMVIGSGLLATTASLTSFTSYYDCIQVNDTTGSVNNSWPGNSKILTATSPTADDGAYTQWTRISGSNDYDMIKEVSLDLDATYVYSNATGDVSAFEFETTTTEPSNVVIVGVCLTCVAKRADVAYLTPVVIRGASYVEVTALKKAVGADYMAPMEFFMETDPITGVAWLMTDLNTTEFGFKHTTS